MRNLGDLLRLVLINEEYGNPKVVVDNGELARKITQKKRQTFYKPVDVHSVNYRFHRSGYFCNKHL